MTKLLIQIHDEKTGENVLREMTEIEFSQWQSLHLNEELKSSEIREARDRLIAETDWTQCADISQATKDKWAPYRKALRDVPQQAGFPFDVIWPT